MFWQLFKTQVGDLGGGKVQSDPQEEAKELLLKKAGWWERTMRVAGCTVEASDMA